MALNQLTGGAFQDAFGNPLASGYLLLTLSHDEQGASSSQVVGGLTVRVPLDNTGNVVPNISVWANDTLTPSGSFYLVQIFKADGKLVSSPGLQLTVTSSPSPFNLGTNWTPNV